MEFSQNSLEVSLNTFGFTKTFHLQHGGYYGSKLLLFFLITSINLSNYLITYHFN